MKIDWIIINLAVPETAELWKCTFAQCQDGGLWTTPKFARTKIAITPSQIARFRSNLVPSLIMWQSTFVNCYYQTLDTSAEWEGHEIRCQEQLRPIKVDYNISSGRRNAADFFITNTTLLYEVDYRISDELQEASNRSQKKYETVVNRTPWAVNFPS